jgi:riboflavin synthase
MSSSKDMFTGLVEAVGEIAGRTDAGGSIRLRIQTSLASQLAPGDSIAVNGVCLTAVGVDDEEVHADVGPETARVSTLGAVGVGRLVNLERPLKVDARLGGHFVLGHVDGVGGIERIRSEGDARWVTVSFASRLAPFMVQKGSIAVDGISLTLAELHEAQFEVMIVPYTWEHTSLRTMHPGERVNLECDVLGKYVVRALELGGAAVAARGRLT